ncbi:Ubiquitin carboxyl-terminal hydrolase isozyme L5 [Coccomyxa sp. Obi]|nr:Ubiquitin carboxyl-terminal hydrolase isozyme L5 [Coccomyxa sp. Obi]
MGDNWTTIESDPGVFTELMTEMGVQGVQMEELYALDNESLQAISPVYGLIFLFKWRSEQDDRAAVQESDYLGKVFFARQVITNACATQAILSVLLNRPDIQLGAELTNLKDFTAEFPPDIKGLAISNSESIRRAHNSFSPPQPIVPEESRLADKDDDVYHFISYVPVDGVLYELDGLKPGPIRLCEATEENWLEKVGPFIQSRIERYAQNEIRFNLMAVIRNRTDVLNEELASLEARRAALLSTSKEGDQMEIDSGKASKEDLASIESDIVRVQEGLHEEAAKKKRWHDENVRRKTNYVPFIFQFLKLLAEKGQLQPIIERAKKMPGKE